MIQNYCPQIFKDLHRLFVTQNGRSNDTKLLPTDFQRFTPIICDSKWQANDAVLLPTDFHRFTPIICDSKWQV